MRMTYSVTKLRRLTANVALMTSLFIGGGLPAAAQTPEQEVANAEAALLDDRRQAIDVLSPRAYQRAVQALNQAKAQFIKKRNISELQTRLRQVGDARRDAAKNADIVKQAIPAVLRARTDALQANASEFAKELFTEAIKGFSDIIDRIERGKPAEAQKRASDVETKFRDAELQAIKVSTVNVARKVLADAERVKAREYAPLSYHRGDSLLAATDKLLSVDRYAGEKAGRMAREAEYHARVAAYLVQLARAAEDDKRALEKQFLEMSSFVTRVARELGVEAEYDKGLEPPVNSMLVVVKNLKTENLTLSQEVAQRNQTIAKLQQDIENRQQDIENLQQQLKQREAGLQAQIAETREQLEVERRALAAKVAFERKISGVEALFTQQEASVVQERGNTVIRLYGLTFQSGQAVILPEYFSLLSKVQRAIREFPDSKIAVEGHTDAVGNDELNQALSEKRAAAVREYLLANMGLKTDNVAAVGYGAARPIANNATEEGRAKNRRIDIVIMPPAN